MKPLNILVLADLHYVGQAEHVCRVPERCSAMALELVQRVYFSVDRSKIDLIILLGDLVDNGKAPGADKDIAALQQALKRFGKPVIAVPGNHDAGLKSALEIFDAPKGYLTCPALCESPFRYTIVTLDGNKFSSVERKLLPPEGIELSDLHTHTHYAYCAENVTPAESIARARRFGLGKIAFTEHAGQLYVDEKDYWSGRFIDKPELIHISKGTGLDRMGKYRAEMQQYRSAAVLVGLEVEVDCKGALTIREEDRSGWDLLIGAVHYLPGSFEPGSSKGFMEANEALLKNGVDILAHPFRYFLRNRLNPPADLYRPLAQLLAASGTAVELNYHTNENDPLFFEICLEYGVPIALGSDAHHLAEVGAFGRHLSLLKEICPDEQLHRILF